MMASVIWAVYGTILVVVGLMKGYTPIRYFAIAVFLATSVKVFGFDLAEIAQIYRVVSAVGLGLALLITSYLYDRLHVRA